MSIFQRLFGRKEEPSLPPLNDPTLGVLHWNADSEGWVGVVAGSNGKLEVYLGSGSAHEYPSDEVRELLREPYARFHELTEIALSYLRTSDRPKKWKVDPTAFVVTGLESYDHYVKSGTYTITFAAGNSEAIWRVNFEDAKPIGCGVDD
ncbi:MAG: hypothetical protein WCI39_06740 [Gallionellaceae bacterium]